LVPCPRPPICCTIYLFCGARREKDCPLRLSPSRVMQRSAQLIKNIDATWSLFTAGSSVRRLIRKRPELVLNIATKPFITRDWDAKRRAVVLIDHCHTVARIGRLVDFPEDGSVELLWLAGVEGSYRMTLEQSRWLQMGGLITFGLCEATDRFFHLSFCLSTCSGELVAYVGGIQGIPKGLDQHRLFTKRTYGMRPRDFLVEAFKLFCRSLGARKIFAVSNSSHVNAFSSQSNLPSYDRLWLERGAHFAEDGFFVLSPALKRRAPDEIPAKKHSLYRKRYELLERVERDFFFRVGRARDNLVRADPPLLILDREARN
jgi:uncharacterized protein VirK/YbjX